MKALTFKGGLHIPDRKERTIHCAITELEASEEMVYPMIQHIGAPCIPLVKVGDEVLAGQKIGDTDKYVSAPIHSSVSGTVTAIEMRRHPNGNEVMSVVVKNDFKYTLSPDIYEREHCSRIPRDEMISIVREAGIVGLGGAAFPTHIKLNPDKSKKIDCIIVNGAECEPYLTSDYRVMLENPIQIFKGIEYIKKITGAKKCLIGIENNKPEAINIMRENAKSFDGTDICVLKTKYPQGSEKQLIKAITGREVPVGKLPADVGVVVNNIDTCVSVHSAIKMRRCVLKRIVTVSGDAVKKPGNYEVRIGTSFTDILKAAECDFDSAKKIIMGGPMMGIAQFTTDVPTVKATSAILAFGEHTLDSRRTVSCVHCGECIRHCPMRLMPAKLNAAAKKGDLEELKKLNITNCMECGICTYVCPCRNTITQNIKTSKAKIREQANK